MLHRLPWWFNLHIRDFNRTDISVLQKVKILKSRRYLVFYRRSNTWKIATSAAAATAPPAFTQTRVKVFAAFTFTSITLCQSFHFSSFLSVLGCWRVNLGRRFTVWINSKSPKRGTVSSVGRACPMWKAESFLQRPGFKYDLQSFAACRPLSLALISSLYPLSRQIKAKKMPQKIS